MPKSLAQAEPPGIYEDIEDADGALNTAGLLDAAPSTTVVKLSSRASQTLDKEGRVLCEQWTFEEDAYTMALVALTMKKWRRSVPEMLLGLSVPAMQIVVFFLVLSPTLSQENSRVGKVLPNGAQIAGIVLCIFQLADEAVEGTHKMTFALRCFDGMYANICPASASFAVL